MSNLSAHGDRGRTDPTGPTADPVRVPASELTDVLSDEYARAILRAVRAEPRPARELVDACGASRPTVYRRLDDLREAGLVETTMECHPDGHHRQVFRSSVEEVTISLDSEGLVATVTAEDPGSSSEVGAAD